MNCLVKRPSLGEGSKKTSQETVTCPSGLDGLSLKNAGAGLTISRDRDRPFFAHLVNDDLCAVASQIAGLLQALERVTCQETEFDVIADDDVGASRRTGQDAGCFPGRLPGIGAVIDVEDDRQLGGAGQVESPESRAAGRFSGEDRSGRYKRGIAVIGQGGHIIFIHREVGGAVSIDDRLRVLRSRFDHGKGIARLASFCPNKTVVDAEGVKLVNAEPSDGVIRDASYDRRVAAEPCQPCRDVGGRAAQCRRKGRRPFQPGAWRVGVEIHSRPSDHEEALTLQSFKVRHRPYRKLLLRQIDDDDTDFATGCKKGGRVLSMAEIGIGIVGGGYMGKAHSVAMASVGAVFDTALRPRLELIAASNATSAERYRAAYGFRRAATDWQALVADPGVEAVVIASPQDSHRAIAEAALALGKPVLCEKPLASTLQDARAMVAMAEAAGVVNMIGFNYIRTPASQFARQLLSEGAIGRPTYFRCEHTEDFLADPAIAFSWRCEGLANGNMGDLAPHPINAALALMGPIASVMADVECVHEERPGGRVSNDDHAQIMCRFNSGVMGHIYSSRIATGRKMGYAYEIFGTKGAIRFDQEDQNALWLYEADGDEARRGFRKILTGPAHPDYKSFCLGPGHGTGYQDQIIIEARDFLTAIETGTAVWPTFRDGLAVAEVVDAALTSSQTGRWTPVASD